MKYLYLICIQQDSLDDAPGREHRAAESFERLSALARARAQEGNASVTDGPFAETKG